MKKLFIPSLLLLSLCCGCTKTGKVYSVSYECRDYEDDTDTATLFSDTEMFDYNYNTKEETNKRVCSEDQEEALSLTKTDDTDFQFEDLGANTYKATLLDVSKYVNKLEADGYALTYVERSPTDYDAKFTDGSNNIRVLASCNGVVRIFCITQENLPFAPPYING